jgi:hypothetical protein
MLGLEHVYALGYGLRVSGAKTVCFEGLYSNLDILDGAT